MAIVSSQVTVTTTPTLLVADSIFAEEVHIHTVGAIFVGDANVTSSTGYKFDIGDKRILNLHTGPLYGVTATGTTTAYVLTIDK
jgi:hypothetical protein